MKGLKRRLPSHTNVDEDQVEKLDRIPEDLYAVEVKPPLSEKISPTLGGFILGILEIQTGLAGSNRSPLVAYEIVRPRNDRLRLQFVVETKRLERKIRTQLSNEISGVRFEEGFLRLPIFPGDSIGGGIITTGREDRFPLQTDYGSPPINSLVSALHPHAMRDTKMVVQILFQPVAGRSVKGWWKKKRGYQTAEYLRKEKEELWGSRSPTPREKKQADAVEAKINQRRFWVSIRLGIIGAGDHTPSRVKELSGAFNILENPETGQYLNTHTIRGLRQKPFLGFYEAIKNRRFGGYSHRFQATVEELSGLVSIPDREQDNIETAV